MLNDSIKSIGIVTGTLIYFYVCGGIYLIGFWSTFDMDISNFISLSDIPKNFIYPFIISNALLAGTFIMQARIEKYLIQMGDGDTTGRRITIPHWVVDVIIFIFSFATILLYAAFKYEEIYWTLACLVFIILFIKKLNKWQYLNSLITDTRILLYARLLILILPVACFWTGKHVSLNIYHNEDVKAIAAIKMSKSQPIIDSTSLKLIGFLGDKAIVSTFDNKRILIVNEAAYEALEIEKKSEKKR